MSFAWESATARRSHNGHEGALLRELADRAALFFRLGVSAADASARLAARVAWEFDPPARTSGAHRRPAALTDAAITTLVAGVYARRPSG